MMEAPNNVGVTAPRALYRIGTGAQRIAEFDPDRSVRITGCGLFADGLSRVAGQSIYPFTADAVNPFPAWRGVHPMSVDPRMMQLADTYQYYAFRALRFTYIPETGTSGPVTQVNLALGISQDSQEFVDLPTPSLTQMLEQNQSILTPVWCTTTISYTHDGTRVWRTDPTGEGTIDSTVQCLLGGVLSNTATVGVNEGKLGELYVEYVCDLYEPQPVEGAGNFTVALPYTLDGTSYFPSAYQIYIQNGLGYPTDYNQFILPPQYYDPTSFVPPLFAPLALARGMQGDAEVVESKSVEKRPFAAAIANNCRSGRRNGNARFGEHLIPGRALGLPSSAAVDTLSSQDLLQLKDLLRAAKRKPPQEEDESTLTLDSSVKNWPIGRIPESPEADASSPTPSEISQLLC